MYGRAITRPGVQVFKLPVQANLGVPTYGSIIRNIYCAAINASGSEEKAKALKNRGVSMCNWCKDGEDINDLNWEFFVNFNGETRARAFCPGCKTVYISLVKKNVML